MKKIFNPAVIVSTATAIVVAYAVIKKLDENA